jgi:DNA recombination protein RmuC
MQPELLIVILLLLILIGAVLALYFKLSGSSQEKNHGELTIKLQEMRDELQRTQFESRQELQVHLTRVNDQVYKGMSDSQKSMQTQFSQTSKIIEDITTRLTSLDNTNKQVLDFSSQLQHLQEMLKNPKHRGILGEYFLETALKNILPPDHFQMQYKFSNGEIVDAVIFIDKKVIPIDSKFSLENYNRLSEEKNPIERERLEKLFVNDLKLRIQETSKYIRPAEGTMDFAFMFIPHEAIYYDLLVNKIGTITDETDSLIVRAASKYHVIIVSPTSFFAYLQTVLQGLRAMKIEEDAELIQQQVGELAKHMRAYNEYHGKVAKNLATTVNQFNLSTSELRKIGKDVSRITKSDSVEMLEIDIVERPPSE